MAWDEMFELARNVGRDGPGINSPVTIVEGGGRGQCGPGPTINLEEYTDYVLKKFLRQGEWAEKAGAWPFPGGQPPFPGGGSGWGPNMNFGVQAATSNTPLKAIGSVVVDSMYIVTLGIICKTLAAGAGTVTLTLTYYDVLTGSQTITVDVPLTATGQDISGPTPIFLLGGSAVTVAVNNSAAYNGASYDAFAGLVRVG